MTAAASTNSHVASLETSASLFSPFQLRGVTYRNRVAMSPMCQYIAVDGVPSDWHLVHLGSRASGGVGLVMVEATAVEAIGRITLGDTGIWNDTQAEAFARIAKFVKSQGAVPGIQLAHAGRKASTHVPWVGGHALAANEGAWEVIGPSAVAFGEGSPTPQEATLADIERIVAAFVAATRRAIAAGFETIEMHAAHGYLLHSFLSPLSNHRTDQYGGSFENRTRLLLQVVDAVRGAMPAEVPLFVRISATDWVEGGWDVDQTVQLAKELNQHGVDLIDVSSGALVPTAQITVGPGYQVPFAERIRNEAGIPTAAVGLIVSVAQANSIIADQQADLVMLGRELLRDAYWVHHASNELEQDSPWPISYGYAVRRRHKPKPA
ncbi:MAG: NADH:flavin oxidoreductase/NADH oxidase [Planctomycetota bacterium]|nr:NADH:flavin oxidoreductase/NADH oxidase [Planctomycetota bacterium]